MATMILGRVRPVDKGEYDASTAYVYLDRVTYNDTVWECVSDTVAGTAPQENDFTYWVPLAKKGEKGETGDKGPDGVDGEKGEKGETGLTGATGPTLQYTWTGGKLSFENADGTFDDGVDLTGDTGDKGETGASYPVPLSNSLISTSTTDAASAYAANLAYKKALELASRDKSDSITLDSSTTYATSKAVYNLCQKIKSFSAPIGTIAYYQGNVWEPDDKSYGCPYVQVNGVWTIIEDWVFCVGITKNGIAVPDLSGLFVLGASTDYPAKNKYTNSDTHTHSGSVASYTLGNGQLPSHTHTTTIGGGSLDDTRALSSGVYINFPTGTTTSGTTSNVGSGQSHSHSYTLKSANKLPPYYQISYIMKVA